MLLVEALKEIPKMRKQISGKAEKEKYTDYWSLEMSAAEMKDGEGQGSSAYFYLEGEFALKVLDAAETMIRKDLEELGVEL